MIELSRGRRGTMSGRSKKQLEKQEAAREPDVY